MREAGCTSANVFGKRLVDAFRIHNVSLSAIFVMTDDWRTVRETRAAVAHEKSLVGVRVVSLAGADRRGRGLARLCREKVLLEVWKKELLDSDYAPSPTPNSGSCGRPNSNIILEI